MDSKARPSTMPQPSGCGTPFYNYSLLNLLLQLVTVLAVTNFN